MKTLVYGRYGTPPEELSGEANQNRLLAAMNRQYGISFAQFENAFRVSARGPKRSTLHSSITAPGPYRLTQSAIATHILVGLLGALLLTTVVTTFTMKSSNVLPKNPCSIGAVASLLADSDFVDMMPLGAENMSDDELVACFDTYKFSMGWWAGAEGEIGKRRFGVDFGTAENLR